MKKVQLVGGLLTVIAMVGCAGTSDEQAESASTAAVSEVIKAPKVKQAMPADIVVTQDAANPDLPLPEPFKFSSDVSADACNGFACCNAGTVGFIGICGNIDSYYCYWQPQTGSCNPMSMWSCSTLWVQLGCNG